METVTNMSSLKSEVSTCVNDGKLYVIGGLEFSISTGIAEYLKHGTSKWKRLPNLITPRYSGAYPPTCQIVKCPHPISNGKLLAA